MQILLICIKIYPETYCSFSPPNKMLTIKHLLIVFYFEIPSTVYLFVLYILRNYSGNLPLILCKGAPITAKMPHFY